MTIIIISCCSNSHDVNFRWLNLMSKHHLSTDCTKLLHFMKRTPTPLAPASSHLTCFMVLFVRVPSVCIQLISPTLAYMCASIRNPTYILFQQYLDMSKDQTDALLRYGQGIVVKGYKPQNDSGEGFMTVRGFADVRANYETISNILYFKNYRNAIFQFLPAGNFQINDELYKLKSKVINSEEEKVQMAKSIETLETRAKSEQAQFQLSIKRKKKQTIKFGDYIMLRHIDSETYLSGTIRPSDGTNGAFSVEVSDRLSAALVFQLLPYRSFEAQSMEIPFSSPVKIKNVYNNGFLTFEKLGIAVNTNNLNDYMQKVPTSSDQSYRIPVKTATENSEVYEVVTHFVDLSIESKTPTPMPWQFQLHFKEVENDSLIQHDIVYLRHTANSGILSAIGRSIVLKQSKNESTDGLQFYESLWEIQKHDISSKAYILRHLMSGMTLGVELNEENEPAFAILKDISEGPEKCELGWIELELAKKDGGDINSESFIYLRSGDYILDVAAEEDELEIEESAIRQSKVNNSEQIVNFRRMKRLIKNQMEYTSRKLMFSSEISKNCFVIKEIQDDLKKELLFALSFHSTIINLREDLKWGATDAMKKVNYIRMMKVTDKISQINDFLKGCSSNDPDKQYKQPIFKRQMICKDLGLSELLFQLLFYIRENMKEEIFKEKVNEKEKFYEMHETIYRVIITLIKNNPSFKIHVSKWILFIFEDFVEKGLDIHYETLLELLKNNQFFLENFVNVPLIEYLLHSVLRERNGKSFTEKRFIDVLRAFCMVGEKVYSSNQGLILKHFVEALETTPEGRCYQIKFTHKKGQIYCKAALDKKNILEYKFEDFQQICKEGQTTNSPKYAGSWDYYTAYLNLLADLTKGRNRSVEKYVAHQLPLNLLSELFNNFKLDEFEVPVIKIIHYLYSENENFYPIDKKNRIVAYDSIESSEISVNHFTGPLSPWSFMESILNKLIQKLAEAGPIPTKDDPDNGQTKTYMKNQVLFELLKLTNQTLNLGFWLRREDILEICNNIVKILEKHPSINYEDCLTLNKENELMIACKIQCLNILDMIIDQDVSISLQICNKVFRNFELPQLDKAEFYKNPVSIMSEEREKIYAKHFVEEIEKSSEESQPIVDSKIYGQMTELCKYNNPDLTSKCLAILHRVLDFKKHRISQFYSQLFVCQPSCVMLAEFLTSLKNKFFILDDVNTTKITFENQKENYFNVYSPQEGSYKQSPQSSIMQDMYIITELMKNEHELTQIQKIPTLDSSGVFDKLGTDYLINFTDCRKTSSLTKQKIVDAANIHLKVLSYISNCTEIPESELALKLLHLCYYLVVSLIENHQEIKPKVAVYMPKFLRHLHKNIGCIDMLRELYDNNKNMLYNETEIYGLIRKVCDLIEKEANLVYKAKLLDFFRYLIYLNGKCLRSNQIQILKIMQDDDYSNILDQISEQKVRSLTLNYNEMNDQGRFLNESVKCEPELIYMTTYLQIINSLIDQNNTVNIGKLIKRFTFEQLVKWISASQNCWILKRNLRAIINRMYYFSVGTNIYLSLIISEEIPNIINDLDRFIIAKTKPLQEIEKDENLKYENPTRFNFLESHAYLNLQENLFTLFSMLDTKQLFDELLSITKSHNEPLNFSNNLIKIAERLGAIKTYYKSYQNVHTYSIIRFLQSRLTVLMNEMNNATFEEGLKELIQAEKQDSAKNYIVDKINSGEITEFFVNGSQQYKSMTPLTFKVPNKFMEIKIKRQRDNERLSHKLKQIFTRKKRLFSSRDQEISNKMEKIVSGIKMSKTINQDLITHFRELFVACYSNQTGNREEGLKNFYEYLKVLIKINEEDSNILSVELKTFILRLIVNLFYEANKSEEEIVIKPDNETATNKEVENNENPNNEGENQQNEEYKQIDEWEAEDWEANLQKITTLQLELMQCGVGSLITSLIKGDICNNISLANEILLCSIAYMLGGNKLTQNNIREELNKDPENRLLINLKKLINNLGSLIRKNIDEEKNANQEESYMSEFFINYTDNYDFYDMKQKFSTRKNVSEPHYVDEVLYYEECIVTYRRAFKFLQLLCENNNIDNKHFIREQANTSESVDFIELGTKQLRNIFQVFCSNISEVPIFILDFILEVTQIPVKLNQDALIKSSFLEDVCSLADFKNKEEELVLRGLDKDMAPLNEIFQKFVQIILSNFEGNDPNYFMSLDKKLDPNFLIVILKQKLINLQIGSKDDFDSYIQKMTEPKLNKQGRLAADTTFDEKISEILEIIVIFMKLRDVVGEKSQVYTAYLKEKQGNKGGERSNGELFQALENCLLKIQIADQHGSTLNVYFPNHPLFGSISEGLKDFIMAEVKRDTHRQKIISLLAYVDGVRQKITEAYNFQKCDNISEEVMQKYYKKASNFSLLICLFMALFYNVYIQYGEAQFTASWPIVIVRFVLSLFQFYYSVLFMYTWYKLNIWIKPEPKSRDGPNVLELSKQILNEGIQASKRLQNKQDTESTQKSKIQVVIDNVKNKASQKIQYLVEIFPPLKQVIEGAKLLKLAVAPEDPDQPKVQDSGEFYKNFAFLLVSFVGAFIYPPFIFIHLIDKICSNEDLANIFKAIGFVVKQLVLVSIMGVAFVVVFSSITFSNYVKDVYADAKSADQMCSNPVSCILQLFVSGAIGQSMSKFELTRFVYDLIYAIFFSLLFGNIVSGLMLDALDALSSDKEELENDKKNWCYVCNIKRETLEKNGQRFQTHTQQKHYLWNYIFYIIALEKKNETDYTGLQYYISQKYNLPDEEMDVSWIPNGEDSPFQLMDAVSKLKEKLDSTEDSIKEAAGSLELKIDEFAKLALPLAP